MTGGPDTAPEHLGAAFWVGLAVGATVMAFGLRGLVTELGSGNPFKLAEWVVGLDLVHDLVLAPLVVLAGLALAAVLPPVARGPVGAAAGLTGVVVLFSVPLITAWGRRAGNSSTLPLNYAHNVLIVVALVWIVALGLIAKRAVTARSRA